MLELSAASVAAYLRERGRIPPGPVQVRELDDGVSNLVLRVEHAGGVFILKQSRPQLRTRDPWYSDIGRIWRERDALRLLHPLLPTGVVPEVLFCDEDNFLFAMSHAPEPHRNWRTVLLGGEIDPAHGLHAGRLLGTIHRATAASDLPELSDRTIFEQLRVEPFYLRLAGRRPEAGAALTPLIDRCRTVRLGLCHGDFSPKNLLLHAAGFTLVDYETCHAGDIAFDLGFFVSHLLLKSIHLPARREEFHDLVRAFLRGYAEARPDAADLACWGVRHLGACLLARVDGASPAPYLAEAGRAAARRLGLELLHQPPAGWEAALAAASR